MMVELARAKRRIYDDKGRDARAGRRRFRSCRSTSRPNAERDGCGARRMGAGISAWASSASARAPRALWGASPRARTPSTAALSATRRTARRSTRGSTATPVPRDRRDAPHHPGRRGARAARRGGASHDGGGLGDRIDPECVNALNRFSHGDSSPRKEELGAPYRSTERSLTAMRVRSTL